MRILSLCDRTGNMVKPWLDAGHECWIVDMQHEPGSWAEGNLVRVGADILQWEPTGEWDMVFAFPPCTHLAVSGARWFKDKGLGALIEALQLVEKCRTIAEESGAPWALENPVSVLSSYWRNPDFMFHPHEYAGYLASPEAEAYTKKTCIWTGGGISDAST